MTPVVRVVPGPPGLAGLSAGGGAQPGHWPRHLTAHLAQGADGASGTSSSGHGAAVIILLLGLDDPGRWGSEGVPHVPAEAPLLPSRPRPLGLVGEHPPPEVQVLPTPDNLGAPVPHEDHLSTGPTQLLLQTLQLVGQLGVPAELQVVEGHVGRDVEGLTGGAGSPWEEDGQGGGPTAGQDCDGLVLEVGHAGDLHPPGVHTDGETHRQELSRGTLVPPLPVPQRLSEDEDVLGTGLAIWVSLLQN